MAGAMTDPQAVGQGFGRWTFVRLAQYLNEARGIAIRHSRIHEILHAEGLRWRGQETWFGARGDADFARKRGALRRSIRVRRRAASGVVWTSSGPRRPRRSAAMGRWPAG